MPAVTHAPLGPPDGAPVRVARSSDPDAPAQLIQADWVHLARVPGLLTERIARLDDDHRRRNPALDLIMDLTRPHPGRPAPDPATIDRVGWLLESGAFTDEAVRLGVASVLMRAVLELGRLDRARSLAELITGAIEHQVHRPGTDGRKLGALALHTGTVRLLAGELDRAKADLEAVTRWPEVYPGDRAGAAGELALLHAVLGEAATANGWADHADSVADGWALDWLDPGPHVAQLCARLILAVDRLDWPSYEEILGRLHTGRFPPHPQFAFLGYAEARAGLVRGQQRTALDRLARLRSEQPVAVAPGSLAYRLLAEVETQLLISLGDHGRARAGIPAKITDHHQVLQLARWQLATGRTTEAAELITEGHWIDRAPRRGAIELSLTLATALDRTGDGARSAQLVRRGLTLAGDPESIGQLLATADQRTLVQAAERELSVRAALERLRLVLFVPPADVIPSGTLTRRERVVLGQLAAGGTAVEIAAGLCVSVHTVRNQIQRIYRKLDATSRRHAIDLAISRGLLPADTRRRDPAGSGG